MVNPASLPVPAEVASRARLLADGKLEPVEARPAATVVLLRDSALGLQLYVLRRRTTMAFAAGMYAFPGGSVDERDSHGAVSAWECAAARELFEETGVLLAGPTADTLVEDTTGESFESGRMALVGGQLSFTEFLEWRGLVPRTDLLALCGHWVTPTTEQRRFDTRFYFARLPLGQVTRDVSGEADRVAWLRPADIEAAVQAGEMRMLPPTAATVAALAPMRTVAEALEAARSWDIQPIQPEVGFDSAGEPYWKLS
jgi:8-oxo-dGTP pyrophosphatase MutT (NUDIX family)